MQKRADYNASLFKYRRFDDLGYWQKLLVDGDLWFAAPENLNDPEEVQIILPDEIGHFDRTIFDDLRSAVGICSFSKIPDSGSCWYRYGGEGDGFALEIDPTFLLREPFYWNHVTYTIGPGIWAPTILELLNIGRQFEQHWPDIFNHLFLTKNISWSGEQEYRFLVVAGQLYPGRLKAGFAVRLPHASIRGIHLGSRVSQANREKFNKVMAQLYSSKGVSVPVFEY